MLVQALALASQFAVVCAHGAMQWPPSWFDANGTSGLAPLGFNLGVMWFSNETSIPGEPTILEGSPLLTYPKSQGGYPGGAGYVGKTPWRAPGSAPIFSPCGVLGGNPHGCPVGASQAPGTICPGGGSAYGPDAVKSTFPNAVTTEWARGSVVEAGWGIRANHGGGYSYRLCQRSEELTEECFQRLPLAFAGEMQHVQWGPNASKRVSFKANRTATGTIPSGSQWTKNPIPACAQPGGGFDKAAGNTCDSIWPWRRGTQFPPPAMNLETGKPLEGFCEAQGTHWRADCGFTIMDQLQVPKHLALGDYVLSFRWDCEQTPQVWTTCANIRVTEAQQTPDVLV